MTLKNLYIFISLISTFTISCENIGINKGLSYEEKVERDSIIRKILEKEWNCLIEYDTGTIQYLEISNGKIKSFPKEFYQLTELKRLTINRSVLQAFPKLSFFNKLQALTLKSIDLKNKKIEINQVSDSLEHLTISHCELKEVCFLEENKIWRINLSDNNLENIDLNKTKNLKMLSIPFNSLNHFDVSNLPKIEWVDCRKNPKLDSIKVQNLHKNMDIEFHF